MDTVLQNVDLCSDPLRLVTFHVYSVSNNDIIFRCVNDIVRIAQDTDGYSKIRMGKI